MDIYLIRHADASPQGENNTDSDETRPLSELGWQQASKLAQAFKKRGIALDSIISSPLVRAQQTATQLRAVLGLSDAQLITCDDVGPGGRARRVSRCINGLQGESIALVGHQPDLSNWVGWLIGKKEARIRIVKGGVALVTVDGAFAKGAGVLKWLITPEWCD